jgi:hypothetical protein
MSDMIDASCVYCPQCDSNFELAWSKNKSALYVLCDCDEAERYDKFAERFLDEFVEGSQTSDTSDNPRGFQ